MLGSMHQLLDLGGSEIVEVHVRKNKTTPARGQSSARLDHDRTNFILVSFGEHAASRRAAQVIRQIADTPQEPELPAHRLLRRDLLFGE
jgi:hypothetical protein